MCFTEVQKTNTFKATKTNRLRTNEEFGFSNIFGDRHSWRLGTVWWKFLFTL